MNFLLAVALSDIGLTDGEQQTVDACLPDAKAMVDALNAALPDIQSANNLYQRSQTLVLRLLSDYAKCGPNISALLGNGWVDIPSVMAAVGDAKSAISADPQTMSAFEQSYNKLDPVILELVRLWPKVKPAYNAIMAALARKSQTPADALDKLLK